MVITEIAAKACRLALSGDNGIARRLRSAFARRLCVRGAIAALAASLCVSAQAIYCIPATVSGCTLGDRIERFSLRGTSAGSAFNNLSGSACSASPAGYTDYTSGFTVPDLVLGESFSGFLRSGNPNHYATIWIDFNNNDVFEDSERLLDNLPIGTTEKSYALYIPTTAALGSHRLRVRTIANATKPSALTDACASYPMGETEDYVVNIVASGSALTVATYVSSGSCKAGAEMTIGPSSNNSNADVSLIDEQNALIARLSPNGSDLGRVQPIFYKHNGPVRQDLNGRYFLNRNITIVSERGPTVVPYTLRFPFLNSELNAMIAQPGSEVTSVFDLVMTNNRSPICDNVYLENWAATATSPTGFGIIGGTERYVDVPISTPSSSFHLHGGLGSLSVDEAGFPRELDVDRSGNYSAGIDGVLLLRYLLGYRGSELVADTGTTNTAGVIASLIASRISIYDVDGDGQVLAISDGLMILRRLVNPTASPTDATAAAAITANAKRTTRTDELIVRMIDQMKP